MLRELILEAPGKLLMRTPRSESRPLQAHELRVSTLYGGICGSDLKVYEGHMAHAVYPVRPGHELLAVVTEVGDDATSFAPGDRVVIIPNTFCGECDQCRRGQTNICCNKQSLGINVPGGFADEWVVASKYAVPVPEAVPDRVAVLVEPFAVAVHAMQKVQICEGDEVLVSGCGTEGALCALVASARGAHVTVTDIQPDRLRWIHSILPNVHPITPDQVADDSFAVVVEAAGARASVESAFAAVAPGGIILGVGMAVEAAIPMQRFVRKEATLYGSIIYVYDDFAQALAWLNRDCELAAKLEACIGAEVSLDAFEEAYSHALSGKPGKALLKF
ncbi:zinc-dependent alcohol dehydrogenase [Alicyclobacillus hesperidum]|uniref:L-iditol 2-dehydrogenase n=1 Tax=Alicyclobacillus hesperidum TaxID=89784 RepID=A0A1H2R731_9BACL|nr:alcohol dehydrogenase catalytic domain-containing protein [Alicyclobacillus hesperidum]SDW15276.1 L-iditol 2-dehydrogenase [Alicyclobacillus hesperidum]